jgi:hypothetical protein
MLINLIWLITCLIVVNLGASRLMSSLALIKAFARLVMIVGSRWVSLAEHSRSSFALVVSGVQVRIFFLFPMLLMGGVNGRSKLMRVGCLTGTCMLRALTEVILF